MDQFINSAVVNVGIIYVLLLCVCNFCLAASCPDGMIFQQCGSFCPKTCEEMDSDELCEGRCAEGCFCPPGQYLLDGRCVDAEICTGKISLWLLN